MKRTALAAICAIALLFLMAPGAVSAEEYHVVKGGECLSIIAPQYGINWRKLATINNIEDPYTIYVGQKLLLGTEVEEKGHQVWAWKNHGADKFTGTVEEALDAFSMPKPIKSLLLAKVKKGNFVWSQLAYGDRREEMIDGSSMEGPVIVGGQKDKLEAVKRYEVKYEGFLYYLEDPLVCHNYTWGYEKIQVIKEKEVPEIISPVEKPLALQPLTTVKKSILDDMAPIKNHPEDVVGTGTVGKEFDLLAGAGFYETANNEIDHKGYYVWGKARWRPLWTRLNGNLYGLGIYGHYAFGGGDDDGYKYDWKRFSIGPSLKGYLRHADFDLDVGWGRQYNNGGIDLYESEQTDDIFMVSAHLNLYPRRDNGNLWFPKTELNFEWIHPLSSDQEHSWDGKALDPDPSDNETIELSLRQGIYDWYLTDNHRLTPEFNFGIGREFGNEMNYYQFGPSFTFAWNNQDILNVYFLNYKERLGGDDQWQWIGGYVDIYGVYRAYQASRISTASDKDVQARGEDVVILNSFSLEGNSSMLAYNASEQLGGP